VDTLVRSNAPILPTTETENAANIIRLWLHDMSDNTRRSYLRDATSFLEHCAKPLHMVTLADLQGFADSLGAISTASKARILSAVKSLLAFAHRLGYTPFNVGAAMRLPKTKNRLAERILPESTVHRMIALETNKRNRAILRLLYAAGLRVSELCGLAWRDTQARSNAGQITVYGKGGKTRVVLLSADTWKEIDALRPKDADLNASIFVSRKHGPLDPSQVFRIVRDAAKRAGVDAPASPHWLRHAHASHALDRGCPIHLVQATLGHSSVATTGRYLHARPNDSSARYLGI
jgi:site-specific recombinase XerD